MGRHDCAGSVQKQAARACGSQEEGRLRNGMGDVCFLKRAGIHSASLLLWPQQAVSDLGRRGCREVWEMPLYYYIVPKKELDCFAWVWVWGC